MTIDHSKHLRLQGDLEELQATCTGLQDRAQGCGRTIHEVEASFRPTRQWRPGDDPLYYLQLSPEQREQYPGEVAAARRIVALRQERAALYARIAALRPRVAALAQLVDACDRYVAEVAE